MAGTGFGVWFVTRPAAAPATPPATTATTTGAPVASAQVIVPDPAALDACAAAYKASSGTADIYDPAKMRVLGKRAAQSANTAIRDQGDQLLTAVGIADAARGSDAEFQATIAMGGVATKLATYCLEQKFVTP
jgi:hypothetical protein